MPFRLGRGQWCCVVVGAFNQHTTVCYILYRDTDSGGCCCGANIIISCTARHVNLPFATGTPFLRRPCLHLSVLPFTRGRGFAIMYQVCACAETCVSSTEAVHDRVTIWALGIPMRLTDQDACSAIELKSSSHLERHCMTALNT